MIVKLIQKVLSADNFPIGTVAPKLKKFIKKKSLLVALETDLTYLNTVTDKIGCNTKISVQHRNRHKWRCVKYQIQLYLM